jgi:hypothetical protein
MPESTVWNIVKHAKQIHVKCKVAYCFYVCALDLAVMVHLLLVSQNYSYRFISTRSLHFSHFILLQSPPPSEVLEGDAV